jgi:hypothetical protein
MAAPVQPPTFDPDDWFAPAESEHATLEQPPRDDQRLRGIGSVRLPAGLLQRHPRRRLRYRRITGAAIAAIVVCTLIGLAVSGVFTSSKPTPRPRPAATTPTPRPTPRTRPRARVAPPTQPLNPGARGPQVVRLQRALQRLGYLAAAPDGAYGPRTQQALGAFQRRWALTPDGILGPQTLLALRQALEQRSTSR